jgi:membrane fusion protein (multidrug efflux system)
MQRTYTFWGIFSVVVIVIGALIVFPSLKSLRIGAESHASARSPFTEPVPIVSALASIEPFVETLEALGTAKANESVLITPTVEDRVVGVFFDDGDRVRRGQQLIQLDDREAHYLLAEARAALEEQNKQYARMRRLAKTNATSLSQLDEEKSLLDIAKARFANSKARLQDYYIRAPFSGILGTRQVSMGAVVDTDSVITTLDDTSVIKLDFTVPEIYLSVLSTGMDVTARSPAYPGLKFNGVVAAINSRVDPETRTLMIRAKIPNPEYMLKPGMLLIVDLIKNRSQALIIPEEAVIQEKDKKYVYLIMPDSTVAKREIATGRRIPGKVEVISGLKQGDPVVIQGITRVRSGSPVNVVEVHETGFTGG